MRSRTSAWYQSPNEDNGYKKGSPSFPARFRSMRLLAVNPSGEADARTSIQMRAELMSVEMKDGRVEFRASPPRVGIKVGING